MISPRRRHWFVATGLAVLLHGLMVLAHLRPADSGAAQPGIGGVQVAFGMAGGAAGGRPVQASEVATEDAEEVETTEPAPAEPAAPAQEVAEVSAEEAIVHPVAEAAPVQAHETASVALREPPPVKPKQVKTKTPPAKTVATAEPAQKVEPETAKETATLTEPAKTARKAPMISGSAGKSGTHQSANTGTGNTATKGGRPGARVDYLTRLAAWLERHKEYPRQARRRREQGTATLVFTVDRQGRVTGVRISKSSGSAALDREVHAMVRRAAPFPAFPYDLRAEHLTLAVPVRFSLR